MGSMITAAVEWGPVAAWAGAVATMLVVITTALVALGFFASVRGPRIRLTFEATEPWCRRGETEREGKALWVRVGVENRGRGPAMGCVGRLISVATDGELRRDVDPVQLRWAGLPRSHAFDPMHVRVTSTSTLMCSVCLMDRAGGWSRSRNRTSTRDSPLNCQSTNVTWYRSRSSPTTRNRSQSL